MIIGIGAIIVIVCVFGGYAIMGGNLAVLWQPFEYVIICGAAAGAYVIANPKSLISKTGGALKEVAAGSPYTKERYIELISLLYTIFKLARTKGMLAIEAHIENPHESTIFQRFPGFLHDHHAVEFLCDYLRILTMGTDNPNQIEDLMNEELDTHHEERGQMASAI
jgi:chemotaxis protein MotA